MTQIEIRKIALEVSKEVVKLLGGKIIEAVDKHIEAADDSLIGVSEAASMLGMKPHTLYKKKNKIPHTKIGNRLLFSKVEISKLVRSPHLLRV